ncbi:MAG TPA: hypothetical protein VK808_07210 [Bacteroidia bacterium]|jgi:hypothetical protein|nr:hypothetical protein [Bacteroidia bacterium]
MEAKMRDTLNCINATFTQLNIEWFYCIGFDESGEVKLQGNYSFEKLASLESNGYKRSSSMEKIIGYPCLVKDSITIVLSGKI